MFVLRLTQITIILVCLFNSILCQQFDEYDDYSIDNLPANTTFNATDYEYEDSDDQRCSADSIIDQFTAIILPDDYEEGKLNVKESFGSFNDTLKAMNRLQEYSRNVSEKLSEFDKRIKSRLSEVLMTIDLPPECMKSLVRIMKGLQNGDLWALKFLDAQPSMSMTIVELSGPPYGNYDECLGIESPPEEDQPVIYGKYCYSDASFIRNFKKEEFTIENLPTPEEGLSKLPINGENLWRQVTGRMYRPIKRRNETKHIQKSMDFVEYIFPKDVKLGGGYCLPTTCKTEDLSRALNQLMYPLTRMPFKLHPDCEYKNKPIKLDKYQLISLTILVFVVSVTLLCSIIDILPKTWIVTKVIDNMVKNTFIGNLITCFSAKRNIKTLFNTKQIRKYKALDGMRAFLSVWIVLMHTYETGFLFIHVRNYFQSSPYKMGDNYRNFFIPNIMVMDNFMFISAFLLCTTIMMRLEQTKGRFNYFQYLVFRYLRLQPILILGIIISFLFEFIGDGPFWGNIKLYIGDPCYAQWYKPLLMISNIFPYVNDNSTLISPLMCVNVSWYASADFQLYALSPIAFLLLYKRPKLGFIWNLILLVFAMSIIPFTVYVLGVPHVWPALITDQIDNIQLSWQRNYWGFQPYIQTYIIGILVAYATRKFPDFNFGGRLAELCIWFCTVGSTLGVMWWQKDFAHIDYEYDGLWGYEGHVYYTFHKVLYLSGFSWLFYACSTGRAKVINNVMGWKAFKIVDNVLIEIYIIHLFVVIYRVGTLREQVTYNDYYILTVTVFDFILSYLVSVVVALLVTKPFNELSMLLVRKPKTMELIKKQIFVDPNQLKIDINNDNKPDFNNNGITDSINGFTNPGLKDIDLKVIDIKPIDGKIP